MGADVAEVVEAAEVVVEVAVEAGVVMVVLRSCLPSKWDASRAIGGPNRNAELERGSRMATRANSNVKRGCICDSMMAGRFLVNGT